MSRLSIPARLMLLSAALLTILVATSIYLNRGLKQGADALVAEARYVEVLRTASAAEKSFGDLKYWLTDLAVSLLNLSEQKARDAKRQFDGHLARLEPYDAAAIAAIRHEVDGLMTRAFEAVDAYTDDRRVIGNMLMADARVHVTAVARAEGNLRPLSASHRLMMVAKADPYDGGGSPLSSAPATPAARRAPRLG